MEYLKEQLSTNKTILESLEEQLDKAFEDRYQLKREITDIKHKIENIKHRKIDYYNIPQIQKFSYLMNEYNNSLDLLKTLLQDKELMIKDLCSIIKEGENGNRD